MAESKEALKGRVAVITGASSGIGSATTRLLIGNGCKVAMGARRLDKIEALIEGMTKKDVDGCDVPKADATMMAQKTDVTKREEVFALVEAAEKTLGPVDILINNAGVYQRRMMKNCQAGDWDDMVDVNIKGVLNGCASVISKMVERGGGHIVNMSSSGGRQVYPGETVYSATKHFVEALSIGMRQELAPKGVRVTSIQPGGTITEIWDKHEPDPECVALYPDFGDVRMLDAENVAKAVLFALTQPDFVNVNEILINPTQLTI